MRTILSTLVAAMASVLPALGLAEENIGPDSARNHPTTEQRGWAPGIIELFRHDARVYSIWVNGGESVYFQADQTELQELVTHFANSHMRDHQIIISPDTLEISSFDKKAIDYNVSLKVLNGIALHFTRDKGAAETHEPVLTIHLDPTKAPEQLKKLRIPEHVILTNNLEGSPLKTPASKPTRELWHAKLLFEDGKPAVDFESGVSTTLTWWEQELEQGIEIGSVNHEGNFKAAFSEEERADLISGESWITITIGNFITKPAKTHPRLPINTLSADPDSAKPYTVNKPGLHYGRILWEDGSPAILDPDLWPGAEVMVSFPYAGPANPDKLGYFQLYFAPDQLEALRKKAPKNNIYVPLPGKKGHSRGLHTFPLSKLSPDKDSAGVVKIPPPVQQEEE